jgi:hypothetical protein
MTTEEEEFENLSVKDQVLLATFLAATLVGFGYVARIGWELAGETRDYFKHRKADKLWKEEEK